MTRFILGLVFLSFSTVSISSPRVIYGKDNRKDVFAWKDPYWQFLASSTAAMIRSSKLEYQPKEDSYLLHYNEWNSDYCSTERFFNQPRAAKCSGFLVAPDLLVTAGHCVSSQWRCESYNWVFNFQMKTKGVFEKNIPKTNLYRCVEILESSSLFRNDYTLLRLDRKVPDRKPLLFREKEIPKQESKLIMIGHPLGLPTKISDGAQIRSNSHPHFFTANLDSYSGNSGSPVFDAQTGLVEGILVRGERDFEYDIEKGCKASKVCGEQECSGEDVTRITNIKYLQD